MSVSTPCLMLILAHPDDESFLAGGTCSLYSDRGWKVVLATATAGEAGKLGDPPRCSRQDLGRVRRAELEEAAAILGIAHVELLGYVDRELNAAPPEEIRERLVGLIRGHRPQVVLTFDPNGLNRHPDHVAISRFAADALTAATDPRWLPAAGMAHTVARLVWTSPINPWDAARSRVLDRQPGVDFALDVTPWRERKAAALRAHRTQHLSIDKYYFSQPDVDERLSLELFRQAWGPALNERPGRDLFAGLCI